MQALLRRTIEDRANDIETFRDYKVQTQVAEGLLLVHGKSLLFLVNHPRQRDFVAGDKISPFKAKRQGVHEYENALEGTKTVQKYGFIEESF
jgi:hypothetical protein